LLNLTQPTDDLGITVCIPERVESLVLFCVLMILAKAWSSAILADDVHAFPQNFKANAWIVYID